VCLVGHLKAKMPWLWGKEAKQAYLLEHLHEVFAEVRRTYQLAEGDFPKLDEYRASLQLLDISTFNRTDRRVLTALQDMLLVDIPRITALEVNAMPDARKAKSKGHLQANGADTEDTEDGRSRQPQMFVFSDQDHGSSLFFWVAALCSLCVLVAALMAASILDDHRTAGDLIGQLRSAVWTRSTPGM
jgi:hypothetical protein